MARTLPHSKYLFSKAMRHYLGFLSARLRDPHSILCYKSDLETLQLFFRNAYSCDDFDLRNVSSTQLERYLGYLKKEGFKLNSRRRKIITARAFFRFIEKRKKGFGAFQTALAAPHKIERIPHTMSQGEYLAILRSQSTATTVERRNRAILAVLIGAGIQTREVRLIQLDDIKNQKLRVGGANPREIPIDPEFCKILSEYSEERLKQGIPGALFLGHNRFGACSQELSARGLNLIMKELRKKIPELRKTTPRTFRHSLAVHWLRQGCAKVEVRNRLGLRSDYAFRTYEKMIKSSS